MTRLNRNKLIFSLSLLLAFVMWTAAIYLIDAAPIGPNGTSVGLSLINGSFHKLTGVNMQLYVLTDWLSLIPIGIVAVFGLLGLAQWVKRKSLFKVDFSILALGGFYIAVMAVFFLFEKIVVNYRPVLINGVLEASYPSSTTMLVMCVMPTTVMEIKQRINKGVLRCCLIAGASIYTAFMVVARLISGVHWLTDIIGGALLSAALVIAYDFACCTNIGMSSIYQE